MKLSVEIARHILNTELTINPEAIYKITEKAVSRAVDKKQILIKVNPEDFSYLKNKKDDLSIYVEDSSNIIIIADPSIKRTSVKIESPSGFVDASIDTQLDIVLKSLIGEGYNAES
jgi:flagellar assembly protein FliH